MNLQISQILVREIVAAVTRAYPHECCGLIEGMHTAKGWRAVALHEAKNMAADARREFLIDPEVQFHLLRALRGTGREIIGCYHSHPDGATAPSQADRAGAGEDGFVWLIAGRDGGLGAYVYRAESASFSPITIERTSP